MSNSEAPLAIVSMACRLPKLDNVDELWTALCSRFVAADTVPADRWDAQRYFSDNETSKGKTWTQRGGFVKQDVKTFDASFFGISPREAENMDPQQRLILEIVWEAFENCGMVLPEFAGRSVGVYVGGFMLDHMITQMGLANRSAINQHTAAGMMMTMLSNRVSHTFDFRGPSLSIDTACSSSLVAFHYGCQDLWRGACEMAVVGGTNVMMRPEYPIGMAKGHFISRDGESKSFDQRGDGYGRGEGAGVVLVKTLAKAIADGDKILSLVTGTGTNQDGHTPGISMPNGEAQLALIKEVCEQYDTDPSTVDYVECHGTGTGIGDPTECDAIGKVYGAGRQDNPVVIGSIKSNIGHTEAVAGIAGVIKATLNVMHRTATPLGNLQTPREDIDFADLGIRLSDDMIPLGKKGEPVKAAVNSFGYGGSNAHVLLQSAPEQETTTSSTSDTEKQEHDMPFAMPVSGRSKEALSANAAALSEWLQNNDAPLSDAIYSAAKRRAQFNHRAVAMGRNRAEVIESLKAIGDNQESDMVVRDVQPIQGLRKPVFVFTGMGPQWWYMGQELYQSEPVFKKFADQADAAFAEVAGFSILEEMQKTEDDSEIQKTIYAQPANLVIQIGVYELLKAAGVEPGLVVGHSVGELGSAYAAGVLSVEDAMLVSYHRSQLQAETAGQGGMLAVGIGMEAATQRIADVADKVSLAAINSPSGVTLAGCIDTLKSIEEQLVAEGIFARALEVEIPYHSPMMEPLMDRLAKALEAVKTNVPTLPLYSTVTGERVEVASFDAEYWPQNIREPVYFEKAIQAILEEGYNTFIEVGPHPVLSASLRDCIKVAGKDCRLIHTLRRNLPKESLNIQRAVMGVFATGCDFDWTPFLESETFVQLPNYQWQRELLWVENERAKQDRINPTINLILGTQEALAAPVWRNDFDHNPVKYLRDHVVSKMPILPAAAYLESMLELTAIQFPDNKGLALRDVEIKAPLILSADSGTDFTTTYDQVKQTAIIRSQENGRLGNAQVHLTGALSEIRQSAPVALDLAALRTEINNPQDIKDFYRNLDQTGLSYGPMFQTVRELHTEQRRVLAKLEIDPSLIDNCATYKLHPTMLDGAFQTLMAMLVDSETTYLPTNIGELCCYTEQAPTSMWCIGELIKQTDRELVCELTLLDDEGKVYTTIRNFIATAAVKAERMDKWGEKVELRNMNYQWDYGDTLNEPKRVGHWLSFGDGGEFAGAAHERMEALGAQMTGQITYADEYTDNGTNATIQYNSAEQVEKVLSAAGHVSGIVIYSGVDETLRADCPTGEKALTALLMITKAIANLPKEQHPRVYVVTHTGFAVDEDDTECDPASTAINGFVRVANKEMESISITSVDLPEDYEEVDEDTVEAFAFELLCDAAEDEVAIRGDARMVSEMFEDKTLTDDVIKPTMLDDNNPVKIRPVREDSENNVGMVRVLSAPAQKPQAGEILLRVEASMLPTNILADQKSAQIEQPAIEVVGEIIEVGSDIKDLAAGQRVCGFAPSDLASHLCGKRSDYCLTPVSDKADASTLVASIKTPAIAMRAVESLELETNDTALVHISPMGLAVAKVLDSAGVKVTLLSEDPEAVDEDIRNEYDVYLACPENIQLAINEKTAGRGFSGVVVGMQSWGSNYDFNAVTQGGWIIDIDENPVSAPLPAHVGAISRTSLRVLLSKPTRLEGVLKTVVEQIEQGATEGDDSLNVSIADIAWQNIPLSDAITRVVIDYDTAGKDLPMVQTDELHISDNATYLITGGFGGFGFKTAEWLVNKGAKHLVMTGRKGASTPAAKEMVEQLEALGAKVTPAACDTSDLDAVEKMFGTIASSMPPLKGVYHCGAVIIDQLIIEADLDSFNLVMQSKATGAYNLHLMTKDLELDHFVLYSSISNMVGNTRQCAYSAANGYLNGLAQLRRLEGLPATSICWGAIDNVGVVAEDETIELVLKSVGIRTIPIEESLDLLETGLARQAQQFGPLLAQWSDWARYESAGRTSTRFQTLVDAEAGAQDNGMRDQLVAELAPLAVGDRADLMCTLLQQIVASVLKSDAETIELDRPVNELGIDSLMATEIQMLFESNLGLSISVMELIGDTTIRALSKSSLESLEQELQSASGGTDSSDDVTEDDPANDSESEPEIREAG